MSVKTMEQLEKGQVALTIEVDAQAFEEAVEKAYRKSRKKINVPGFRPGKASRKIIESMYGAEVFYNDAIDELVPEAYKAAVTEKELDVVGYPEMEVLEVSAEKGLVVKATVALYPEVKLGSYEGLEAVKPPVSVTDADVAARLDEMVRRNSRLVSVERAVEMGDTANIDFEGFEDGEAFEGGKGEKYDLEIGSGSFVPGFEEQLVGMTVGEEKDINLTFPDDYHADLAGKPVVFHVKLNGVKVKEAPALDDEFAKDVSEFDTLDALKEDLTKKITEEREAASKAAFEDALMDKVADGIEAVIPDALVAMQQERLLQNFKMQIENQGIPFAQYLQYTGKTEEQFKEEAQEPALRQVRMDLAIEALVKAEDLSVSDEEVEAEYQKLSEKFGMDVENVKKYVPVESVKEQLLREKVIALVASKAVAVAPETVEAPAAEEASAEEAPEKPKKAPAKRSRKPKEAPAAEEESESK